MKKFHKETKINNNYVCLDIESSSRDPYSTQILELAAIVYDCNTLLEKENGRFHTLVKPTDWEAVEEGALKVNNLTKEELAEAPENHIVFDQFRSFLLQFQKDNKAWSGLIPCGQNIKSFDMIILELWARKYNYVDKQGRAKLLHPFHLFDLSDIIRLFFHHCDDLSGYGLDDVAEFMGIKRTVSHRALADVETTWIILKRYLEFFRRFSPSQIKKFRGCFNETIN